MADSATGSIVGGVIGGVAGTVLGPWGTVAGAGIGAAIGGGIESAVDGGDAAEVVGDAAVGGVLGALGGGIARLGMRAGAAVAGTRAGAAVAGLAAGDLLRLGSGALGLFGDAKGFANQLGQFNDEATVVVAGNPFCTRRSLFEIAAATAFGLVQRIVPAGGANNPFGPPGIIGIAYDAASNELAFTLKYSRNLATIWLVGAGAQVRAQPVFGNLPQTIVGGEWDASLPLGLGRGPDLEFGGRPILTTDNTVATPNPKSVGAVGPPITTPNPRPAIDSRSRGTLTWLVYQTLAAPAETGPHTYNFPPNSLDRFAGA